MNPTKIVRVRSHDGSRLLVIVHKNEHCQALSYVSWSIYSNHASIALILPVARAMLESAAP